MKNAEVMLFSFAQRYKKAVIYQVKYTLDA